MVRPANNASSSQSVVPQGQGTTIDSANVSAGLVVGTIAPSTSTTVPSMPMTNVASTQSEMASMHMSLPLNTGPHSPYMAMGDTRFQNMNIPPFPLGMYGMPTGMPHISTYSPTHISSESVFGRNPAALTNTSLLALRQQVDESNHDMVNMLTQQIGTVFNPLIQNTNNSYQMLAN